MHTVIRLNIVRKLLLLMTFLILLFCRKNVDYMHYFLVLRRLVCFGFRDPASSQEAMSFINMVFSKLDSMLDCRKYWQLP